MKVGLIGGVNSSLVTLKKLIEHGFNIEVVFGYKPSKKMIVSGYCDLEDYCTEHSIRFHPFTRIRMELSQLADAELDILFVVGISQLIPIDVIDGLRIGCIGFHPTSLPRGRGRAPLAWMVRKIEGGAATFFQLGAVADAGAIFVQEHFEVEETDDAAAVENKVLSSMERALDSWLPKLKRGIWDPVPQNELERSEYGVIKPVDGLICWQDSAWQIDRLIKASSSPHPGAYTYFGLEKLIINKSRLEESLKIEGVVGRVLKKEDDEVLVQTGNGLIWVAASNLNGRMPNVGERLGYLPEYEIHKLKSQIHTINTHLGIPDE